MEIWLRGAEEVLGIAVGFIVEKVSLYVDDAILYLQDNFGFTTLNHIFKDGSLLTFDQLKQGFNLPNWMFFRYMQLRHAFRAQFPNPITLESHPIEHLLISKNASSIYLCHQDDPIVPEVASWYPRYGCWGLRGGYTTIYSYVDLS